MEQDGILEIVERELKKKLGSHVKKIILFGSRARGDHKPDSDYDLLVVLDEISPSIKDKIYEIGGDILYDYNIVLSFLPIMESAITEKPLEPFLTNAMREGIVSYECTS